jgi:hypothetical protein
MGTFDSSVQTKKIPIKIHGFLTISEIKMFSLHVGCLFYTERNVHNLVEQTVRYTTLNIWLINRRASKTGRDRYDLHYVYSTWDKATKFVSIVLDQRSARTWLRKPIRRL